MVREAWWAIVHRVAESDMTEQLSTLQHDIIQGYFFSSNYSILGYLLELIQPRWLLQGHIIFHLIPSFLYSRVMRPLVTQHITGKDIAGVEITCDFVFVLGKLRENNTKRVKKKRTKA